MALSDTQRLTQMYWFLVEELPERIYEREPDHNELVILSIVFDERGW